MASLSLKNVCKVYPNGFVAVKDFNLDVADKEFIIFVGPSGCGKSTTLRMIAGLEEISSGELWIGDKLVNDVEPKDRDIAMVFQNYALYPHMTVYDNMSFGLKLRKVPKPEIDKLVHEAAKILGIEQLLDRKPKALSGGQRQRVAMGRAIVRNPKVFLMDEPLSNLDAKLRVQISSIRFVPSRHGTHLPQLSFCVKFIKKRATSTIQVLSSITTRPPEPIIAPIFFKESKSRLTSKCGVIRHPPDGPPI